MDRIEERDYTTEEAAELLGVSRDRVIDLCNAGRMGRKFGRDWVISAEDIRANQERKPGRGRNRYLRVCPRGFSNETALYRVAPEYVADAERIIERYASDPSGSARWVTLAEAEREAAGNRMQARRQKAAGLNLYQNPVGATEIEDFGAWIRSQMY